jgi:hypothetical protein
LPTPAMKPLKKSSNLIPGCGSLDVVFGPHKLTHDLVNILSLGKQTEHRDFEPSLQTVSMGVAQHRPWSTLRGPKRQVVFAPRTSI